jgi:class 3 adenylate cyclase/tetratricopeptide (TPR) repeat protein
MAQGPFRVVRPPGGTAIAHPVCPTCGRAAGPDDRFCGRCGNALALVCSRCGRAATADLAYCTGCGQALRPAASGANDSTDERRREERRRVSVLFVDAIGSTPFAEQADPETVRAHQTDFFATVRRVVRQYGGVVEKFIGDAAMVLFGAPVATEADAVRAVRAGLDLQRALARPTEAEGGWTFRVGIATGEALVDVAAAHDGGQAIVAGDVVNTAARLQSEAPAAGVLVCGTTHAAARTEIRFAAQPQLTLRGRSAPTEVWLALAPVPPELDDDTGDLPLVGRDHELALLTSALQHVIRQREPRLVTVLGPAGIGKSRLVRELYQHARQLDDAVCWRSGRCPPFGENVAYAALADIVKAQAGVLATDSPDAAWERLDAALRDLLPATETARLSDALRPLVGLPGSPLSTEDAESAWRRFLLALAGRGPTVLVFEDLHWADDRMIRFVELIGATVRDVPLLVVCTARPELVDREPSWAGAVPGMLSVSLTPLRDDSIATLYAGMFGGTALPPRLLQALVELADGMPLYAQEYGRMLVERGTLRQADDEWILEPSGVLPTPDSVHAVIANRIDLLDDRERAVLQAAAVVGARFWPGAVAAALGTGPDAVERALRTLTQRDLVREQPGSSMAGEPEYRFRHGLVSDVCYERLPLSERIARHVRTADWLEARLDGRGAELIEVVAHHRFTAYQTATSLGLDVRPYAAPALTALRHAARRAAMLNAFDAAAAHVAWATELVSATNAGAPAMLGGTTSPAELTAESDRLGVELLGVELALHSDETTFLSGPGPERLTELANLLYRARDHDGAARAWTLLGETAWLRQDRSEALRCLDRAVELFDTCPDTPEKAQAYAELGRLHMLNYEHVPALGATEIAAEIAERLGLVEMRANALITIGMCRYLAGEPGGLVGLQDALEFCRTQRLPSLRRARSMVANALIEEGELAQARDLLDDDGSSVAIDALYAGDWDLFFRAADAFLASPLGSRDLRVRGARGWLRALRGDGAGAEQDTATALQTARSSGFWRPMWTALAHGAFCDALLHKPGDAELLLHELGEGWRRMRTIASGEWVAAAAHAADRVSADAALLLRDVLGDAPHHTAWSRAAMSSVDGTIAAAQGDFTTAAVRYLDAAERYRTVGSATDRMLALGGAVRALSAAADRAVTDSRALVEARAAADPVQVAAVRNELAEFAARNRIVSPL